METLMVGFTSLVRNTAGYDHRLALVGADGPVVSRDEVLAACAPLSAEEIAYLDSALGVRATYHADVVCAFLASSPGFLA